MEEEVKKIEKLESIIAARLIQPSTWAGKEKVVGKYITEAGGEELALKINELIDWQNEMVELNPLDFKAGLTGFLKLGDMVGKLEARISQLERHTDNDFDGLAKLYSKLDARMTSLEQSEFSRKNEDLEYVADPQDTTKTSEVKCGVCNNAPAVSSSGHCLACLNLGKPTPTDCKHEWRHGIAKKHCTKCGRKETLYFTGERYGRD